MFCYCRTDFSRCIIDGTLLTENSFVTKSRLVLINEFHYVNQCEYDVLKNHWILLTNNSFFDLMRELKPLKKNTKKSDWLYSANVFFDELVNWYFYPSMNNRYNTSSITTSFSFDMDLHCPTTREKKSITIFFALLSLLMLPQKDDTISNWFHYHLHRHFVHQQQMKLRSKTRKQSAKVFLRSVKIITVTRW